MNKEWERIYLQAKQARPAAIKALLLFLLIGPWGVLELFHPINLLRIP